jgi:hypothetical protein
MTQRSTSVFSPKTNILKEHETFPVNEIRNHENGERWIIQVNVVLYILLNISSFYTSDEYFNQG